jgi:hypothetical protein
MKEITVTFYQCEICKKQYSEASEAYICESRRVNFAKYDIGDTVYVFNDLLQKMIECRILVKVAASSVSGWKEFGYKRGWMNNHADDWSYVLDFDTDFVDANGDMKISKHFAKNDKFYYITPKLTIVPEIMLCNKDESLNFDVA